MPDSWGKDQACILVIKNRATLCVHPRYDLQHTDYLDFPLLFSEMQTERNRNKLRFAIDVKNILEGAPGPSTDAAKGVFFTRGRSEGKNAARQLSNEGLQFLWSDLKVLDRWVFSAGPVKLLIHSLNKYLPHTYHVLVLFKKLG